MPKVKVHVSVASVVRKGEIANKGMNTTCVRQEAERVHACMVQLHIPGLEFVSSEQLG